jgi:hypothetical protein
MTDERTLDRLIAHLRAQVAAARRLELEGADPASTSRRSGRPRMTWEWLSAAGEDAVGDHVSPAQRAEFGAAGAGRRVGYSQPGRCGTADACVTDVWKPARSSRTQNRVTNWVPR